MECKYSPQVQAEINEIKKFIKNYHNLFSLKIEYSFNNLFYHIDLLLYTISL